MKGTFFTLLLFLAISLNSQEIYRVFTSQEVKILNSISPEEHALEDEIYNSTPNLENEERLELVIHNLSSNRNINKDVINEQVNKLNYFFNKSPKEIFIQHKALESFYNLSADPKVYFCEEPIVVENPQNIMFSDFITMANEIQSISKPIDETSKINIWIVDMPREYAGFAYGPKQSSLHDGIYINSHYFGTHADNNPLYTGGGSLLHLMGTFFGVKELWNQYQYCSDDLVSDTPIHNYANFTAGTNYQNRSICDGMPFEMIINVMDNLPDEYMHIFTQGQVKRMKAILQSENGRRSLVSSQCYNSRNRERLDVNYKLSPNPNNGSFFLTLDKDVEYLSMKVFSNYGKMILEKEDKNRARQIEFSMQDFPDGFYTLVVTDNQGNNKVINFIKAN